VIPAEDGSGLVKQAPVNQMGFDEADLDFSRSRHGHP
jgi:hypothetical protein